MDVLTFSSSANEDLYSKALFKTIAPEELKLQLNNVGLLSECDSYLVMTLKLRLHILRISNGPAHFLQSLEDEILKEVKTRFNYRCCVLGCTFRTASHRRYQLHFTSVLTLRKHIELQHWKQPTAVSKRQNVLVEQLVQMKCLSIHCGRQTVTSVHDLKNHLISHFERGEKVSCIFSNCAFESDNRGSMRSHFSRKHKEQDIDALKEHIIIKSVEDDIPEEESAMVRTYEEPIEPEVPELNSDGIENDEIDLDIDEVFTKSLAICFNTWMNISGIAYSTVSQIVKEIFNSYGKGAEVTKCRVKMLMEAEEVSAGTIQKITEALKGNDPFEQARDQLESEFKRKKYIKNSFPNVQPVTVKLSSENEDPASYQYVPIKESLKLLVEDETYIKQRESDPYQPEEGQITDARDGLSMKNNPFFSLNPEAVPLLLFQDELEADIEPVLTGYRIIFQLNQRAKDTLKVNFTPTTPNF